MGSLSQFLGQPKEVEIDGMKITLHPIKVKDMAKLSNENENSKGKTKVGLEMLKLSIPDATEEEINDLPLEIFTKIMEEINKLNGFTDERVDTIKKRIEQQRKAGN